MIKQEKRKLLVILPLLILCVFRSPAQTDPVGVQTLLAPLNTLSITDLDFINATTPKWLFTITLTPNVPVPLVVSMRLTLAISIAGNGTFDPAAYYQSNNFELVGTRSLTNFDLRDPAMKREFRILPDARQRIEETALPGGVVPSGSYRFRVQIFAADGTTLLGDDEEEVILSNPGVVELLLPSDGEMLATQYPLFQWRGDAPSWQISVYQRLPGQASLEESASGAPHMTATVSGPTFQYPAAGARLLETGASYVWFVEGLVRGSGGTGSTYKSPIRSFTISDNGLAGPAPSLLDELERTLGPQYRTVFDQIRSEGLSATGVMKLNGMPISRSELLAILNALRTAPGAVSSAVLE